MEHRAEPHGGGSGDITGVRVATQPISWTTTGESDCSLRRRRRHPERLLEPSLGEAKMWTRVRALEVRRSYSRCFHEWGAYTGWR